MKQLVQNLQTGETLVVEVPTPTPGPGMALVHTAASLVSTGTERMLVAFAGKSLLGKARARPDLARQVLEKARREGLLTTVEAAFSRLGQPIPLGYSSSGTVEVCGEGLEGVHAGQRVACAGGGYAVHAEYALVPRNLLVPLPEEVDFESAAFATLGAIAMHGFRLTSVQVGSRVAVIGLGLLGFLAAQIAAAAGCRVFGVDLDPWRVERARVLGFEAVSRTQAEEAARAFSQGRGCDAVLICADTASNDPVELAGTIARDRATVVAVGAVGLELPRRLYYEKELTFLVSRSYGPGRYDPAYEEKGVDYPIGYVRWTEGRNLEAFVDLLAAGRLDLRPLITHRYPIAQAPEAYALITGKQNEPFLGVLITYPGSRPVEKTLKRPGAATPSRPSTTGGVRLGVLGAGNFATTIALPALRKNASIELVGVASASGLPARNAMQRFGFRYATSDEQRILDDPHIDTVAIFTRHHLHARQVLAAHAAGKHVFCEKPLAITRAELDKIEAALASAGEDAPLLTVGFNRRFAPLSQHLSRFLAGRQAPLVAHYRVNAGPLPASHWLHDPSQGGGRLVGEGCHFIDYLTYLVGEPPSAVTARALPAEDGAPQDNLLLVLRFGDGSLGSITYLANGDRAFPKERLEVFCGGRVAVLDDFRTLETVQGGHRQVKRTRLRQDKGHRGIWEAFTDAIQSGSPPPIPYSHLMGVARATFAARQALREGKEVPV